MKNCIVIGGGAAGFFSAITAKLTYPSHHVILLEKTNTLLAKVRISGGGRCNVTHSCFDPKILVHSYPRGVKELLGPFHTFQPKDTIAWFEKRGVTLKTEPDGRMFPTTNRSETIINCLLTEATKLGVDIRVQKRVEGIDRIGEQFSIRLRDEESLLCDKLILATGSNAEGHKWAQELGHTIQQPLPSLFTFNVPSSPLLELSGISVPDAELELPEARLKQRGPLLLTHFGFSGPAALKLSAFGAPFLFSKQYQTTLKINWLPSYTLPQITAAIQELQSSAPTAKLGLVNPFPIPKNLWKKLIGDLIIVKCAELKIKEIQKLAEKLRGDCYQIEGKTTHKEEFVTCGGVTLKEVQFQTMESKFCPHLHFAGEILDIDGITGGFNFQNAWTTGFLAGKAPL